MRNGEVWLPAEFRSWSSSPSGGGLTAAGIARRETRLGTFLEADVRPATVPLFRAGSPYVIWSGPLRSPCGTD